MILKYRTKTIITLISILLTPSFGNKYINVDLTQQKIYAYEDNELVIEGKISTGKKDYRTPTGSYYILQKKEKHKSSKYPEPTGGADMNYMLRLTYSGIAMHLGVVPKYPDSHGCIRLGNGLAQEVYSFSEVGTHVNIFGAVKELKKISNKASAKRKVYKEKVYKKIDPYKYLGDTEYYPEKITEEDRYDW